jgi:WD40 repeat protein
MAARTFDGGIHVFDADRRKPFFRIPSTRECGPDDCPRNDLVFLDDDRLLVLTYGRNMRPWYSMWQVRNREQLAYGDVGDLVASSFAGETWQIALPAAWTTERVPVLLDVLGGRRYVTKPNVEELPHMQSLSPDGRWIAWSDERGFLHLSSSDTGAEIKATRVTPSTTMKVTEVQWSPSGASVYGLSDGDVVMVFDADLTRRFGTNVAHLPKWLHPADDERLLYWSDRGLFCLNTYTGDVAEGWGQAVGPAAIATVGDLAWVNIGGQGVVRVDLSAFCPASDPKGPTEGEAPTSR